MKDSKKVDKAEPARLDKKVYSSALRDPEEYLANRIAMILTPRGNTRVVHHEALKQLRAEHEAREVEKIMRHLMRQKAAQEAKTAAKTPVFKEATMVDESWDD